MKRTFLVSWLTRSLILLLLFSLNSCKQQAKQPVETEPSVENPAEPEDRLVINNATLEEVDDDGKTVWKMKADQTSYNEDTKLAFLENPAGNLYQDGKIVTGFPLETCIKMAKLFCRLKLKKGKFKKMAKLFF